ncbi:sensor histidine kinase [Planococcus sp. APC 3906]|uniref:sensor histidine kinase n=1 Tax=Planococcus TaxID=1372 RepID=UPI0025B39F11|nr:ATP-binding protein [Planococcus sp. APC 3906]MDN3451301.1 ATP-binding protein [Planococcus sp. APC 3906]
MKKPDANKTKSKDVFSRTRNRLTLFYSLAIIAFLFVFVLFTLSVFYVELKQDQEKTLTLLSDREVSMAERALYGSGGAWREQERRVLAENHVFYYITDNSGDLMINQDDYEELRFLYLDLIDNWVTEDIEIKRFPIDIPKDDPLFADFQDFEREVLVLARPVYHDGNRIAMMYMGIDNSFYKSVMQWLIIVFSGVALLFALIGVLLSRWMAKRAMIPVEQAYNVQREFVSNASHELRTPLSVILSAVEALEMESGNSPFSKKIQTTLKHEVKRMSKLITELLALARSDSDQAVLEVKKEWFNFRPAAAQVMASLSELSARKGIQLELDANDEIFVQGDSDRLTQLLYILGENAIKYTPSGGKVQIALSVEHKKRQGELSLTVKDNGIGMAPGDRDKIFERFYRADKARSRKEGGYGLGLSIAKSIVDMQGGTIGVDSTEGEGTVFKVHIPFGALPEELQKRNVYFTEKEME